MITGLRRMATWGSRTHARSQAIAGSSNSADALSRFREDVARLWSGMHMHLLEPLVTRRSVRGDNVNLNVHPAPVSLSVEIDALEGGPIPPISRFVRMR
jgi:hypothetical protein